MTDDILQAALAWHARGIATIPLDYGVKQASIKWGRYQKNLPSEKELAIWFGGRPRNLAVITGWQGLTVIDFDSLDWYLLWNDIYHIDTYQVLTARGVHVYLFEDHPSRGVSLPGALDIKSAGGYVLAPPSKHPSGWIYQVLTDAPIARVESVYDLLPDGLFDIKPDLPVITAPADLPTPAADPWQRAINPRPHTSALEAARATKILDILPGKAIPSSQDGRWYLALCPFHDDHNPSFWIDTARGLCGCHTCRGKQMDVINLYARLRGIDNSLAITELATRGGVQ